MKEKNNENNPYFDKNINFIPNHNYKPYNNKENLSEEKISKQFLFFKKKKFWKQV
jgi:hypothetical protein